MKISKLLVLLLMVVCFTNTYAQSPQTINYQAVVRDASGGVVANKVVTFRLSILTGSSTGTPQYIETHNATTNAFGLGTLNIGLGTPTTGTMSAVTWATGSKFLRVEVDINGGSNYFALGTTQFLSVPFALYAATAGNSGAGTSWLLNGNATTATNYIGTINADDLRFNTVGLQKMVLKTTGYLGIGTNTPDFKVVVENAADATAGIDDGRTLMQLHNKSAASYATTNLRIKTGNTQYVTMLSHYGPTYTQYPHFADYGLMLSTGPGLMMQAPAGNIRFMTGPAPNNIGINDRMIITNDGYVGIGTINPTHRLHVETNSDESGETDRLQMLLHNSSSSNTSFGGLGISAGFSGSNTWLEHLSSSYSVYANTYPDFNDMTYLVSSGNNGMYLLSGSDGANTKIRFAVGSTNNTPVTRMTLNKTGLGLGTETPKAKIEVANGDVYVSDATKGIILKSPNGNCWRVTMDNTGNFVRSAIACPN